MNNISKLAVGLGAFALILSTGATVAFAAEDGERGERHRKGHRGLITQEIREDIREQWQNLSEEEQESLKEERRAFHEERKAAFEEFTGLTKEELREAKHNGENIGDILAENGVTEETAETFLSEQGNAKVDKIVETFEISDDDEQTLRDRVSTFVDKMLSRWFGN